MSDLHPSDAGAIDDLLAAFQLAVIKANVAQNAVEWDEALTSRTAKERSILRNDLRARLLAARSPAPSDDCGLEQSIERKTGRLLGEPALAELDAIVAKIRANPAAPSVEARDAALPVFGMPLDENHPLALEAGEPRIIEHSFGIAALLPPEKT